MPSRRWWSGHGGWWILCCLPEVVYTLLETPAPSLASTTAVTSVVVSAIGPTSATIVVNVVDADGSTVYARYSPSSSFPQVSTVDLDAVIPILFTNTTFVVSGLDENTTYYVAASYDVSYPPSVTEEATFVTLPLTLSWTPADAVSRGSLPSGSWLNRRGSHMMAPSM